MAFWKKNKKNDEQHDQPADATSHASESSAQPMPKPKPNSRSAAASATVSQPSHEEIAELDAAREAVVAASDRDTEMRFWKAVFALPTWHFVAAGAAAAETMKSGGIPPVATLREGEARIVPFFSTPDRASLAGHQWTAEDGDGTHAVLSMPTKQALEFICTFDPDVVNAIFDHVPSESDGYGTQIDALPGMYEHFIATPPPACLGRMSKIAQQTQHPLAYQAAYRVIAAHEAVWFLQSEADGMPGLMQGENGLVLPSFSNERIATAVAEKAAGVRAIRATPAELFQIDQMIADRMGEQYAGTIMNMATDPLFIRRDWLAEALQAKPAG